MEVPRYISTADIKQGGIAIGLALQGEREALDQYVDQHEEPAKLAAAIAIAASLLMVQLASLSEKLAEPLTLDDAFRTAIRLTEQFERGI